MAEQILKWYRDNYGLVIQVVVSSRKEKTYNYVIIDLNSDKIIHSNYFSPFSSYEQAEEEAIKTLKHNYKQLKNTIMKKTIFLGGTCNNSTWRDELIPRLTNNFFNPVVENWTPECQEEEIKQRETCDLCLYVITPKMTGVYSIAEVVDDSNKRPAKTVFYFTDTDGDSTFEPHQVKALKATGKLVEGNGGFWAKSYDELLDKLNS